MHISFASCSLRKYLHSPKWRALIFFFIFTSYWRIVKNVPWWENREKALLIRVLGEKIVFSTLSGLEYPSSIFHRIYHILFNLSIRDFHNWTFSSMITSLNIIFRPAHVHWFFQLISPGLELLLRKNHRLKIIKKIHNLFIFLKFRSNLH